MKKKVGKDKGKAEAPKHPLHDELGNLTIAYKQMFERACQCYPNPVSMGLDLISVHTLLGQMLLDNVHEYIAKAAKAKEKKHA